MSCIEKAIEEFEMIVDAFKKDVPDGIMKTTISCLMDSLQDFNIPQIIEWKVVGTDISNVAKIDGKDVSLPNGTLVLKLGESPARYFLAQDHIHDTVTDDTYCIGNEITNVTPIMVV